MSLTKPETKLLQSIPIFSKLNEKELEALQKISSLKHLHNDNMLFYEGDESKIIHVVIEGKIEVYKVNAKGKKIILKQFLPFSFIAEVSNYNNINFPASAQSVGDSTILLIQYKEFEKDFLYHQTIAPVVLRSMANKVINLEKIISSNLTMDAIQRVAQFIYENEDSFHTVKHNKIAENLNMTPVTFSRILKKFKDEEIIKYNKERYFIDKKLLKNLFS